MTRTRISDKPDLRLILTIVMTMSLVGACMATESKPNTKKWTSLFNGKDLTGWTPKITGFELGENFNDTFRVEDGVLKVCYDKWDKFDGHYGHLFYKESFSNYRLRLEYRFVGRQVPGGPGWALRNNGIMLHCQPPETMRKDQDFPVSAEAQLLGGNGKDKRTTGNLCTPGTHVVINDKLVTRHCTNSNSETYHGDQWVTMEVEVHGHGLIRHLVNGKVVLEYEQVQLDETDRDARTLIEDGDKRVSSGHISLQAESHPTEFRKIEILLLED